jgi:predicted nucleic acid-binding protein
MLVVLDTNVFYTDVRANGLLLRSMLDDALAKGAFALFVPEVVLRELDKQFAQRSKKIVREVNKALGAHEDELRRLGIQGPSPMVRDDADIARTARLVKRLSDAGAEVLSIPADLTPVLDWAVNRRKPFKDSGEGFPDAVIWLSVLELALSREDEIVLISNNSGDFAVKKDSDELAEELRSDLVERGRPPDQVRLSLSLRSFAEEIGVGPARDAVAELAADGAFFQAIENAIMYSPVDPAVLDRPIELDNDPQITGWDLEELTVESAVELPGGRLVADCAARVNLELDLLIFKPDYYGAPDELIQWLTLSNGDFNRHYAEAQTSVELDIEIEITTNKDGSGTQVEIGEMSLRPWKSCAESCTPPRESPSSWKRCAQTWWVTQSPGSCPPRDSRLLSKRRPCPLCTRADRPSSRR